MHKKSEARAYVPNVTCTLYMRHKRVEYVTDAFSAGLRHVIYTSCMFRYPEVLGRTFAERLCGMPQACDSSAINVCNAPVTCV